MTCCWRQSCGVGKMLPGKSADLTFCPCSHTQKSNDFWKSSSPSSLNFGTYRNFENFRFWMPKRDPDALEHCWVYKAECFMLADVFRKGNFPFECGSRDGKVANCWCINQHHMMCCWCTETVVWDTQTMPNSLILQVRASSLLFPFHSFVFIHHHQRICGKQMPTPKVSLFFFSKRISKLNRIQSSIG